jgi:gamma-glutamyl-gamma-aminobutyraldehyde dehydrogenase/4-guanidinobutyraldehyde dehydrogenase/NAD-dependent aldehyde dehydrogenase
MDHSHIKEWHSTAETITFRTEAFINGDFRPAKSGKTFESISPIDGRHLADIACCGAEDVDDAVLAARAAFESGAWANKSPADRKAILLRLADLIRENRDELALLVTLDMGKTISDSRNIELKSTANCFAWYAECVDKLYDEIAPTAPDTHATITREPLGVVAAVVPWNFPLIMAAWKIAPALAMGNSVILKPSEFSTLSALRLAELAHEAGIPAGVFNVIPGFGSETGRALGLHMDINGLFFTGSTQVGKYFMEYAAQSNLKRVGLELGGKSPNIILASYKDTRHAAETAVDAAFFNQGEMCTCPSRLIVEEGIYDEVIAHIKERAAQYVPSNPLNETASMGALVHSAHAEKVFSFVEMAKAEGASLIYGGSYADGTAGGCYFEPTIFSDVTNDMRIAQEEVFGPVLVVIKVKDVNEAIAVANDTNYGLASAVWTDDLSTAHYVSRSIRSGLVYVNCYDADDITTPFGGFKESGIGRDKSLHALDKYAELKTTWMKI